MSNLFDDIDAAIDRCAYVEDGEGYSYNGDDCNVLYAKALLTLLRNKIASYDMARDKDLYGVDFVAGMQKMKDVILGFAVGE